MKLHLKLCLIVALAASAGLVACGGSNHKKSKNKVRAANEKVLRDRVETKQEELARQAEEDAAKTAEQIKQDNAKLEKERQEAEARENELKEQLAAAQKAKEEAEQKATDAAATTVVEKTAEEVAAEEKAKQEEDAKAAVRKKVADSLVALQRRLEVESKSTSIVATKSDLNIKLSQEGSDVVNESLKVEVNTKENICVISNDNNVSIILTETVNEKNGAIIISAVEKQLSGSFKLVEADSEGYKMSSFIVEAFSKTAESGSDKDTPEISAVANFSRSITAGSNDVIGLITEEITEGEKKFLQINGLLNEFNANGLSLDGKQQVLTISGDFRCTVELK